MSEIYGITPGETSYFSEPSEELDPKLFDGTHLKPWVSQGILSMLFKHLEERYEAPHSWTKAWLAGSGVSYQWAASREPGDLDCLVGIDYVSFRQNNPDFSGLSDQEIAKTFNEGFNQSLMPNTRNWEGYELTYYVNPQSDIRDINPYAAYDLVNDAWTVEPDKNPQPPYNRDWEQKSKRDEETAAEMLGRYTGALRELNASTNPAYKINAQRKLEHAATQAIAFYDDIHSGRKAAFSKTGAGYSDYNNYRWQAGKKTGIIQALRALKEHNEALKESSQKELYGVELPDASTLIRRTLRG